MRLHGDSIAGSGSSGWKKKIVAIADMPRQSLAFSTDYEKICRIKSREENQGSLAVHQGVAKRMNPAEKKAMYVLIAGGVFFIIAMLSYVYAEYLHRYERPQLEVIYGQDINACTQQVGELHNACIQEASDTNAQRIESLKSSIVMFVLNMPLTWITFATIFGYSGLVMWYIQLPAHRRPWIAISAIGILLQTMLMVGVIIHRFLDLTR